ncbi:hypothetical protein Saso_17810 [Streptomyces asoensis]|uniref:Uncharacterized protein n=1 Tax=Streptomyces asoensis TaxID=249586 RepID=A0ABQ3RW78_9ACTN|nr:hypothetical protein GCM10010496_35160 [Streptomyces asoensis]GHI60131.1 hypothetical protein Saso_17810 [Streptomyces asoensis]
MVVMVAGPFTDGRHETCESGGAAARGGRTAHLGRRDITSDTTDGTVDPGGAGKPLHRPETAGDTVDGERTGTGALKGRTQVLWRL